MSSRLQSWRFSPSVAGVLLTLAGVALFLRLGFWQLDRADEKQALLEQYHAGERNTLTLTSSNLDALSRYQHVRLQGRYESARQILLDNMPSEQGRPGYRVLTPLRLPDGGRILVDRGWIPAGATRTATPEVAVDDAPREVSGRLDDLPRPGLRLSETPPAVEGAWPRVLHFPRREDLERVLQAPLPERIVLLDPALPDGYERAWRARFRVEPSRHVAYAVQWFAFALLALVLFVFLSRKRPADEQ